MFRSAHILERGKFLLAVPAVLALSLVEAERASGQAAQLLAARWKTGQSWRVEYSRGVPSPVAAPDAASSSQRSVWKYRVTEANAQQVRLAVEEEGGQGRFDLWFRTPDLTLQKAVRTIGTRQIDQIVHTAQTAYFGAAAESPLLFDWPTLPRAKESATREFTDDNGQRVTQTVRFPSPSQFEIVMTQRRTIDKGFSETRRSAQTWTVGDPWWSEASIRTESVIDGEKSSAVEIQGRLLR